MRNNVAAIRPEKPAQKPTVKQVNSYHQGLERLIERVERSSTHYDALDVRPTATHEHIRLAYLHALTLLYPPYAVAATIHEQMASRIERAFSKVSWAFAILGSRPKRTEYDKTILTGLAVEAVQKKRPAERVEPDVEKAPPAEIPSISVRRAASHRFVYAETARRADDKNRRRCDRLKMTLPVRVSGQDRNEGKWHEMANTVNVSRTGITLHLRRLVKHGAIVYINLPLPAKLRAHGYSDPSYNVYALVRRVQAAKNGIRVVALEFLGESPPSGYLEKPWAIFRTAKWAGGDRRRARRKDHTEQIIVEYITGSMAVVAREKAKTENVSSTGARIFINNPPEEFDLVRVICSKVKFDSLATVSNRYFGIDGAERLCVQFINKEWPM